MKMTRNSFKTQNNFHRLWRHAHTTIDMNIQDGEMDNDFVSNKAWYLVCQKLYWISVKGFEMKHIESALSNGESIIFVAISL